MNNTKQSILEFRDDRNWKQFHKGKDLAMSLSIESAELLEAFQWSGDDQQCLDKVDKIKEELADIFIYAILMADCYGLDMDKIVKEKLTINNEKYPVSKSKGNKEKYTKLK